MIYTPSDRDIEQFKNMFTLKERTPDQLKRIHQLKESARKFGQLILQNCPAGREKSVAMTQLQEAVLWAEEAIAVGEKSKVYEPPQKEADVAR